MSWFDNNGGRLNRSVGRECHLRFPSVPPQRALALARYMLAPIRSGNRRLVLGAEVLRRICCGGPSRSDGAATALTPGVLVDSPAAFDCPRSLAWRGSGSLSGFSSTGHRRRSSVLRSLREVGT